MSRTSEMYKFVDMDADQIDADVVSIYSAITGKPTPTGMDLLFCRILSNVCLYNAANTNYAANETCRAGQTEKTWMRWPRCTSSSPGRRPPTPGAR